MSRYLIQYLGYSIAYEGYGTDMNVRDAIYYRLIYSEIK
jgi:hypothetical protein